ncbi:MAG TPA: hypothetical protein VGI82_02035 [Chitinophagaceae bacterium]|jgi:hypothetical protein
MKKLSVVVIVFTVLFACSKSMPDMTNDTGNSSSISCSGVTESFSKDVNPIIQSSCATGSNCHASGSVNGPGELITYTEIQSASAQIRAAVISGEMPKTGSLTASQKSAIICWIDNGASNN